MYKKLQHRHCLSICHHRPRCYRHVLLPNGLFWSHQIQRIARSNIDFHPFCNHPAMLQVVMLVLLPQMPPLLDLLRVESLWVEWLRVEWLQAEWLGVENWKWQWMSGAGAFRSLESPKAPASEWECPSYLSHPPVYM